jgi:hypothetical protein
MASDRAAQDRSQRAATLLALAQNGPVLAAFSKGSKAISCGTSPIRFRAARKARTMSCPPAVTLPDVGCPIPQIVEISLVLPAPFGPSWARISTSALSRETGFSAWSPEEKVLVN